LSADEEFECEQPASTATAARIEPSVIVLRMMR
jgi:hypothetical protein